MDRCTWKRCKETAVLTWLERPLCQRHWYAVCELTDGRPPEEVKREHTLPPRTRPE